MASSTPSWMVLVTAALAVVGTLAAAVITQVLSGRRESHQWERQREQELARWERERAERQEQWEREDHARWHQERLAAYTALRQRVDDWMNAVGRVVPMDGLGPALIDEECGKRVTLALAEITRAESKSSLFASEETAELSRTLFDKAAVCWARMYAGGLDTEEGITEFRASFREVNVLSHELLESIRRDLGLKTSPVAAE